MTFSKLITRRACVLSFASLAFLAPPVLAQNKIVIKSLADLDTCASSFDSSVCLEPLQAYAKTHPKELFEIGKKARVHFKESVALQFFEPAFGKKPSASQCGDEDLGSAVISGLATPPGEAPQLAAVRIFSGVCHAALRPKIEKEIVESKGEGYVSRHACPVLAAKGAPVAACESRAAAKPPAQPSGLPQVDLGTAKFGSIKVYVRPQGERITVANIPAVPGAYAIRFDGIRGDFNGKTLVHQESPGSEGFEYWTMLDGKRWTTLTVRGSEYKHYRIYVPASLDTFQVHYSEQDSKLATEAILRK